MMGIRLLDMTPHTAAKHLLLRRYLDRWFPILGKYHSRLRYIDGFAGPGEYANGEEGSPLIAVKSALQHVSAGTLPNSVDVEFVFVERKKAFADHLRQQLAKLSVPSRFNIALEVGQFSEQIEKHLDVKDVPPTFAFVDPFGFSGLPIECMARILKHDRCEVFVNVMVEHINRFLQHPDNAVVQHFPATFGTDDVLEIPNQVGPRRVLQILDLYKRQLAKYAEYVGQFDMHGRNDQNTYSLFFASNDAKGFLKMKEANWSVDKATGSRFSDAHATQEGLFTAMGIESLWDDMMSRYGGQTVPMSEVDRFVAEETDYLPSPHARQILKKREERNDISVIPNPDYKRRAGTFPTEGISIRFQRQSGWLPGM